MAKSTTGWYDGRGVWFIDSGDDVAPLLERCVQLIVEQRVILRRELGVQRGPQLAEPEGLQVVVEVAPSRRQGQHLDARRCRAFGQCRERPVARGIGVANDVEPA